MKVIRASLVAMFFVGPAAAAEAPHVAPIRAFAIETVSRWIADPALIEAVRAQNIAHAGSVRSISTHSTSSGGMNSTPVPRC